MSEWSSPANSPSSPPADQWVLPEPNLRALETALQPKLTLETAPCAEVAVTLLDSFDWRLHSAGCELHYAAGNLELRQQKATPPLPPLAVEEPPAFVEDLPDGSMREQLSDVLGIRRLLPMATWCRHERAIRFLDPREKTVVRATLATLEIGPQPMTILNLVAVKGYDAALGRVRRALADWGAEPSDRSEGEMAARSVGRIPGAYDNKLHITLDPAMRSDLAMRWIHLRLLDIAEANIPGMRRALDPEFLHDFRVALRKSRSALGQVRHVFPPETVVRFKEELRWLFRQTGHHRDLDVFLLSMPEYRELLPRGTQADLDPLEAFLSEQRVAESERVDQVFGAPQTRQILAAWRYFLESELEGAVTDPKDRVEMAAKYSREPIGRIARRTVSRVWRRVLRDGEQIAPQTPDAAVHALRVRIKKLRYMLEFFASVLPSEASTLIRETKRLQDNLGRFADFSVQRHHVERFAAEMSAAGDATPSTLLAMGRLLPLFEAGQSQERQRFHETFERFASRSNRRLMDRILK